MKVKELMIGDWFHNNYTNENYQVWPTFLSQATNYGRRLDATFEDINITPIPLTQEILEKNGWKWNEYNTMMDLAIGTIHIGWEFYKDCLSISDHSDEGNCQISSLRCKCVHKLQHTLRLCGIEKEIIL